MRVAIPVKDGQVFGHFGQAQTFLMIDLTDGKVTHEAEVSAAHTGGHHALIDFLAEQGVTHVVAGNMGQPAHEGLMAKGMEVSLGARGDAHAALEAFQAGTLVGGEPHACDCGHDHDHHH